MNSWLSKGVTAEIKRLRRLSSFTVGFICFSLLASLPAQSAQLLNLNDPTGFFTNVASRLLRSELGIELNRIQIYPTNQYTQSVHRLLQVTANVYDAATNRPISDYPFVPSVFRPLFTNDAGAIYICGYAEETGTNLLNATMRDVTDPADRAALQSTDMVYGIPAIIGAKKGWPNFNEFGLQNDIIVSRRLNFHRLSPGGPIVTTNQVYTVGVSNAFGIEAWNSYSSIFPRPLQMSATVDVRMSIMNQAGISGGPDGQPLSNTFSISLATNIPAMSWAGFTSAVSGLSFIVPSFTNYWFLTNSLYLFSQNAFTNGNDPANFFPNLELLLNISASLRFTLVDTSLDRIVDYVNLTSDEDTINLAHLLNLNPSWSQAACNGSFNQEIGSLFCTNRPGGTLSLTVPNYGVINQFSISMGFQSVSYSFWRAYNTDLNDPTTAIPAFRNNVLGYSGPIDFSTPFNPQRTIHHGISWQANDPLVHYQAEDLSDLFSIFQSITFDQSTSGNALANIGGTHPLNGHYRPWGGNPLKFNDTAPPTKFKPAIKDPAATNSDRWNFPTNAYPSLDWLGKVHRGTPWQTLFLKSTNVDAQTWQLWTGVTNPAEAQLTMPTNDWRIASLLVSILSTNDPCQLYSLNQQNPDAWREVLDGLSVLTNTGPSQFDTLIMSSNSPQAAVIAHALDANRTTQPDHYFHDVGDILATPELSTTSPWLNLTNSVQSGITDEAYEKIPAQLLLLLRPDSFGSLSQTNGTLSIRFTGIDDFPYAVQVSSNLSDWLTFSTNYPKQGLFHFIENISPNSPRRFYRSVLLP